MISLHASYFVHTYIPLVDMALSEKIAAINRTGLSSF